MSAFIGQLEMFYKGQEMALAEDVIDPAVVDGDDPNGQY